MTADDWFPVDRDHPRPDDGEVVLAMVIQERKAPFLIQAYYWRSTNRFYLKPPSYTEKSVNVSHWQYIEYPRDLS